MVELLTVKQSSYKGYEYWIQEYTKKDGVTEYQYKVFDEDGDTVTVDGFKSKEEADEAAESAIDIDEWFELT